MPSNPPPYSAPSPLYARKKGDPSSSYWPVFFLIIYNKIIFKNLYILTKLDESIY